ncbi:MAG: hypothetical protein R3B70_49485, partial [Polyangiaceae bacterium]
MLAHPTLRVFLTLLLCAPAATLALGCSGDVDTTGGAAGSGGSAGSGGTTATGGSGTTGDGGTTGGTGNTLTTDPPLCGGSAPTSLTSGAYLFVLDIQTPVGTQMQLFADVKIDPSSNAFIAQLTNADRNTDLASCPIACDPGEACKTVPSPACVPPSEKATTEDEYPDFIVNAGPPTGYTFAAIGCIETQPDGANVFTTGPSGVTIPQPQIELEGLVISCT